MLEEILKLQKEIISLKKQIRDMNRNFTKKINKHMINVMKDGTQSIVYNGLYTATCTGTADPQGKGRVQYYDPINDKENQDPSKLSWADQISAFGGFDDSGSFWVPPAGSTIALMFKDGDPEAAYYLGTVQPSYRGEQSNNPVNFGFPIPEWEKLWNNKRIGYLIGGNDGKQSYHPWNTENYNGNDILSQTEFETDPIAQFQRTYPNIYGMKTPNKNGIKLVDGNPKCNNRWGRIEIRSSNNNVFLLKDDLFHPAGQWASTKCGTSTQNAATCNDASGNPLEKTLCCLCKDQNCTGGATCPGNPTDGSRFQNPYYKRMEECFPYMGPPTPQQNQITLPQTGIALQSRSGMQFCMDDSVESPTLDPTQPNWLQQFGFGCTDKFLGKMWLLSATGHKIELNDSEDQSQFRGANNGIIIKTAAGVTINLNDQQNPGNTAGPNSGVTIQSRSNHELKMSDNGNQQTLVARKEGGVPVAAASNAYIQLRSGYGTTVRLDDAFSQGERSQQKLVLYVPSIPSSPVGPIIQSGTTNNREDHLLLMDVAPNSTKVVLRSGGILLTSSLLDSVESIGEEKPIVVANKVVNVSKGSILQSCSDNYVVNSDKTLIISKQYIILASGPEINTNFTPPPINTNDATATRLTATKSKLLFPVVTSDPAGIWVCPLFGQPHFGLKCQSDQVLVGSTTNKDKYENQGSSTP